MVLHRVPLPVDFGQQLVAFGHSKASRPKGLGVPRREFKDNSDETAEIPLGLIQHPSQDPRISIRNPPQTSRVI